MSEPQQPDGVVPAQVLICQDADGTLLQRLEDEPGLVGSASGSRNGRQSNKHSEQIRKSVHILTVLASTSLPLLFMEPSDLVVPPTCITEP